MDRVVFRIEETGEPIPCLLNPESVLLRRESGVRARESAGGLMTGAELLDDPLLLTGGGWTELTLNLLFDVNLERGEQPRADVREITGKLWRLAENARTEGGYGRPPHVRFFWGKRWNIPGIITSLAERLEYFSADGAPRRSWLRLRMLRAVPSNEEGRGEHPGIRVEPEMGEAELTQQGVIGLTDHQIGVHEVAGVEGSGPLDRLDVIAARYYGNPAYWRLIAQFNRITNPLHLFPGMLLELPSLFPAEDE